MATLAFVPSAPVEIPYATFKGLATGAGFGASTLGAAAETAIGAILAQGAAILGAGAAGFAIGQQILKNLEYTGPDPTVGQSYRASDSTAKIRVLATGKFVNQPELQFDNVYANPVFGPVSRDLGNNVIVQGVLFGPNATFNAYMQGGRELFEHPLQITSVSKENGQPVENLKKVPGYLPTFPIAPYTNPKLVPVAPGIDPYPITPTVIPNPANNPEKDDEQGKPGVIVQIPETGQQITFSPTGVTVGRYKSPATAPYEVPSIPPPPTDKKVATDPCPCPESKVDLTEVLCRLKALEKGLLDDGFDYTNHPVGASNSTKVDGLPDELFSVELNVVNSIDVKYYESGNGIAPDALHCGWFSWRVSNKSSERIKIPYAGSVFVAPPGVNGYSFTTTNGAQATSNAVTRKRRDYVDSC